MVLNCWHQKKAVQLGIMAEKQAMLCGVGRAAVPMARNLIRSRWRCCAWSSRSTSSRGAQSEMLEPAQHAGCAGDSHLYSGAQGTSSLGLQANGLLRVTPMVQYWPSAWAGSPLRGTDCYVPASVQTSPVPLTPTCDLQNLTRRATLKSSPPSLRHGRLWSQDGPMAAQPRSPGLSCCLSEGPATLAGSTDGSGDIWTRLGWGMGIRCCQSRGEHRSQLDAVRNRGMEGRRGSLFTL